MIFQRAAFNNYTYHTKQHQAKKILTEELVSQIFRTNTSLSRVESILQLRKMITLMMSNATILIWTNGVMRQRCVTLEGTMQAAPSEIFSTSFLVTQTH